MLIFFYKLYYIAPKAVYDQFPVNTWYKYNFLKFVRIYILIFEFRYLTHSTLYENMFLPNLNNNLLKDF